jgi:toxin ParE1/3/4
VGLRYHLSFAAERDIREIARASLDRFGSQAADRYRALILGALQDLADDPERRGSRPAGEAGGGIRFYHLRHALPRAGIGSGVRKPRHLILYRITPEHVAIVRLLHDSMDLPRRVNEAFDEKS